jgi:hypothetical protein
MSRPCTACGSPDRAAIDLAIVAGDGDSDIARRFGIHRLAVARHRLHQARNATAAAMLDEMDDEDDLDVPEQSGSFGQQLDCLIEQANELLKIARASGDIRASLAAIREARGLVDSAVKLKDADGGVLSAKVPRAVLLRFRGTAKKNGRRDGR